MARPRPGRAPALLPTSCLQPLWIGAHLAGQPQVAIRTQCPENVGEEPEDPDWIQILVLPGRAVLRK